MCVGFGEDGGGREGGVEGWVGRECFRDDDDVDADRRMSKYM